MNILDYYKYAQLATAAYVRLGGGSRDGVRFATLAASKEQQRLPLSIGQFLFDPRFAVPGYLQWSILSYYGGDIPTVAGPDTVPGPDGVVRPDMSGFAATLFQQGENGEKVLAIRGTEPFADGGVDLLSADVGQIGVFGLALTQLVSLVNLIQRLKAPADTLVRQISVHAQFNVPDIGIPVIATGALGRPVYLVFDTYNGRGEGDYGVRFAILRFSLRSHQHKESQNRKPDPIGPIAARAHPHNRRAA